MTEPALFLPLLLTLAATAFLYALIRVPGWCRGERLAWALAWAPALAFGVPSVALFAARWCGFSGWGSWVLVALPLLALLAFAARWRGADVRGSGEADELPATRSRGERARAAPLIRVAGAGLLLVTVVLLGNSFRTWRTAQPEGMWDAVAIWNSGARFLARAVPERLPELIGAQQEGHPQYPLFLGAAVAAQFELGRTETTAIPLGMSLVFLFGLGAAAHLLVRLAGALLFATPAVLLVMSTPIVWKWAFAQVADLPLAYLAVAAALPLVLALERPRAAFEGGGPPPVLAGFVLGLLPWTKDEGTVLALVLVAVTVWVARPSGEARASRRCLRSPPALVRRAGPFALGALPGCAAMLIFKLAWAPERPPQERFLSGGDKLGQLADPERWRIVAGEALRLLDPRSGAPLFGFAWPLLAVGLLFWAGRLRRRRSPGALLLLGTAAVTFAGYIAAFLLSPYDLSWHVGSSMDRLLLQLLPLAAAGVFSLAGSSPRPDREPRAAETGLSGGPQPEPPADGVRTSPALPSAVKLSVVVPVYNERYLVRELLRRVLAVEDPSLAALEVLVVDDGSTDGTRQVLRELAAAEPRLRYFEHARNQGKGSAIRTGIAAATGDVILFQDADLEYDPRDYPRLVRPILEDGADVVYGSRFLAGDRRRVLQFRHSRINRILTWLSNLLTNLDLTDMETCYKVFRAELLKSIPLRSDDFGLEPEITAKIAKRGFRIFEVPVSYLGRAQSEGKKIGWRDGFKALGTMLRFWLVDDVYAPDEYGSHILTSLEKARHFNRWMADEVRPHIGNRVLEIGAGIGNITVWLLPRDLWMASDINPNYLHYLRNLAAAKPYLAVQKADLGNAGDFAAWSGRFDTVLCLNVLEHVEDPLQALRNMRSTLAPGGSLVLYVPQGQGLYSSLDEVLGHRCRYDLAMLQRELAATGLELVSWRHFNRAAIVGWWWNGKVLRRRSFSRVQLKLFDLAVPLLRRVDRFLPWRGLGLVAVARRIDPAPEAPVPSTAE